LFKKEFYKKNTPKNIKYGKYYFKKDVSIRSIINKITKK